MQEVKSRDKVIFLLAILAIFCWIIYLIKSVLTPFLASLAIAYFLNPLVNYLNRKKLSRLAATSLILGLFITIFSVICIILLPIIGTQFIAFLEVLPRYLQTIGNDFYPKIANKLNLLGLNVGADFASLMQSQNISSYFLNLSQNIFTSSLSFLNILSLIFITPLLVFYLLKDWDLLLKTINSYLPRKITSSTKKIAREIDKTLSGYVRGQFNVCLILSIFYSTALSFTDLNFGFLIGFLTGLLAFIPYVGMFIGTAAALIVALFQWGFDSTELTIIALIFTCGNILESNFLTPKLIGKKIGLHPVWLIFGLFAFGALFGFVGVLIAVPLTATCGTIIKHFASEYKKRFT
jgi:predicted PurR-regulated permease PerM